MKEKIAIQGIEGSFHHQVAQEYYGKSVGILNCSTFREVAQSLSEGKSSNAVMAIENSIVGSILPNYALIDEYDLRITGEHYVAIDLNLMALPGVDLEEVKKVYSHPMALLQCSEFFRNKPRIKLIEDTDTAGAARRIAEKGHGLAAAVASKTAAEIFGLNILAPGVHNLKSNFTRFLILEPSRNSNGIPADKASFKFELTNKPGSLAGILNILRDFELDMTKIQSLPVPQEPWKYAFFIDVLFSQNEKLEKALEVLQLMTEELKVFGTYKNSLI